MESLCPLGLSEISQMSGRGNTLGKRVRKNRVTDGKRRAVKEEKPLLKVTLVLSLLLFGEKTYLHIQFLGRKRL